MPLSCGGRQPLTATSNCSACGTFVTGLDQDDPAAMVLAQVCRTGSKGFMRPTRHAPTTAVGEGFGRRLATRRPRSPTHLPLQRDPVKLTAGVPTCPPTRSAPPCNGARTSNDIPGAAFDQWRVLNVGSPIAVEQIPMRPAGGRPQ